ncbi:MAG: DUF4040 domain-containing protein [Anaerolineae bacterium]|nr:DUF4040 domain-containing protein [Anaerolineae bacterium]
MEAWLVALLAGAVVCAFQAIRATRLLASAIWLAGVSALVSLVMYMAGAPQVAVIELSVGAGLVTVLFVFAISIAGEDAMDVRAIVPRPVGLALVIVTGLLLGWMTLPALGITPPLAESVFAEMLWQERGLDVLVQIVLIFAGVVGVLGLLSEESKVQGERPASRPELEQPDNIKEIRA